MTGDPRDRFILEATVQRGLAIVADMQRVATDGKLSGPEYDRRGTFSSAAAIRRYGTWQNALTAAGLESSQKRAAARNCEACGKPIEGSRKGWRVKSCGTAACKEEIFRRRCESQRAKGAAITPDVARGHARKLFPATSCARCNATERLHRHHRDRNPRNNSASNIEILCVVCHGKEHGPEAHVGSANHLSRLTEVEATEIRKRCTSGEPYPDVARAFHVSRQTVSRIARGLTWTHVK